MNCLFTGFIVHELFYKELNTAFLIDLSTLMRKSPKAKMSCSRYRQTMLLKVQTNDEVDIQT